jgi:hypothetical protein
LSQQFALVEPIHHTCFPNQHMTPDNQKASLNRRI